MHVLAFTPKLLINVTKNNSSYFSFHLRILSTPINRKLRDQKALPLTGSCPNLGRYLIPKMDSVDQSLFPQEGDASSFHATFSRRLTCYVPVNCGYRLHFVSLRSNCVPRGVVFSRSHELSSLFSTPTDAV